MHVGCDKFYVKFSKHRNTAYHSLLCVNEVKVSEMDWKNKNFIICFASE